MIKYTCFKILRYIILNYEWCDTKERRITILMHDDVKNVTMVEGKRNVLIVRFRNGETYEDEDILNEIIRNARKVYYEDDYKVAIKEMKAFIYKSYGKVRILHPVYEWFEDLFFSRLREEPTSEGLFEGFSDLTPEEEEQKRLIDKMNQDAEEIEEDDQRREKWLFH